MQKKRSTRYGKNMVSLSTTIDADMAAEIQRLAALGGISPTAWARQAIIEAVEASPVYKIQKTVQKTVQKIQSTPLKKPKKNEPS